MANPIPESSVGNPLRRRVYFQHGDPPYTATLSADLTLTRTLEQWLALDCNGTSRTVTCPAPGNDYIGDFWSIRNAGQSGNLYLKTSAGVLLSVIYPGDTVEIIHGASDYSVVSGWAVGRPIATMPEVRPGRYRRTWIAGSRGKPGLNADINSATEATREIADPDFELLGTNASSDDATFYAEGGILIETDGADGDEVIILPHLDANQSAWAQVTWGTGRETIWECFIGTTASIANAIVWAGLKLTNTEVTATDNDQAFFRYEDDVNSGEWQAIHSVGGTDTATDTNVIAAVNTRYHLQIVIDAARLPRFYLNGSLVKTGTAMTDATDLIPYIGVAADGAAAAKSLRIYGQTIERNAV